MEMIEEGSEPEAVLAVSFFLWTFLISSRNPVGIFETVAVTKACFLFNAQVLGPKPDLPPGSSDDAPAEKKNKPAASLYLVKMHK